MKSCSQCGVMKSLDLFRKHVECVGGRSNVCKLCLKNFTKKYEKTKPGFLMRLYRNMKSRITGVQKGKFHLYEGKDLLSKETFYTWANNNSEFHSLFKDYELSEYNRKLAPSVDRIDPSKGYSLDNMEFVTMSENSRRSSITRKTELSND